MVGDWREPLIVTQNGEARAVIQDVDGHEQMRETLALLSYSRSGDAR